jgi:hypothetical protein
MKEEGPGLGIGVPKIHRRGGSERTGVCAVLCPGKEEPRVVWVSPQASYLQQDKSRAVLAVLN